MRPFVCGLGEWVNPSVCSSHFTLWARYNDDRRNPIDFVSRGQMSRSTMALCVWNLVGMIHTCTTVFAQSLSNLAWKLWMMRGWTLLNLGHGVKGQGLSWHDTDYSFCPITFKLHMHVVDNERFWVIESNSKVNFWTLLVKPCGHNTGYSFCPITS